MPKFYLTLFFSIHLLSLAVAQERCGTEKFDSIRRQNNPRLETIDQFEKWMSARLSKSGTSVFRAEGSHTTYTIPVVVHIIHSGQAVGTGINISDAQVNSQIKVLNNDFQRLNADASQTPAVFQPVAGSMSIEFVLAKQDPFGNDTNGIVRVNGGKPEWQLYEDAELKGKSYWPAEQYFNIWVTNFPEYLGYTQFPVSNQLGIEDSPQDRLTDGIIVHYRAFGSIDDGAFNLETQYNKGRTLTHEVGHFFGLRHIWGDNTSCSATDYVNDTPPQNGSTLNCPPHPAPECPTPDPNDPPETKAAKMFQNYLDYTDDRCMNIFTVGQVNRMIAVLNASPRRVSLLTSPGASPPGTFSLDLGILSVQTPTTLECGGTHTPTITIRNFGTTTVTQANIELKIINGSVFQTKSVVGLSLGYLQQTDITFNGYSSSPIDSKVYQFKILNVNGVDDENAGNNIFSVATQTAAQASTPYLETFESTLSDWNVVNPDGLRTWNQTSLGSGGNAILIENYNYEIEGALDKIVSPVFDVSSATGLLLKFKLAHAHASSYDGDALAVYAFTGCSDDLANATRVFFEEGADLGTTASSSNYFIPSEGDWQIKSIPLNDFLGSNSFRFAFVSRNGYGNNIYIDEVELVGETIVNLSIQKVIEPSLAVCESPITPKIEVANLGTTAINGFTIKVTLNGIDKPVQAISEILNPADVMEVALNPVGLLSGSNEVVILVTPNGTPDSAPSDNTIIMSITLINNSVTIPVRENFDEVSSWSFVNPSGNGWTKAPTNFMQSAVLNSYDNTNLGEEAWLVSPRLDLSNAIEASMFADFGYAYNFPNDEFITVAVSDNCGKTFDYTLLSQQASNLTDILSASPWVPTTEEDWIKKYFNLNDFTVSDKVLVAIQVINNNGNNLYVDNIEFFENDDPNPPVIAEPFRIYTVASETRITFNLEESQTVQLQIASIMGSEIINVTNENTLNQTLTFQTGVLPGIYIFKILIGGKLYVEKQFMGN